MNYPRSDVDDLTRLERSIARAHANDLLTLKFEPKAKLRPLNFNRIKRGHPWCDMPEAEVEELLVTLVRTGRVHVTNGAFWCKIAGV